MNMKSEQQTTEQRLAFVPQELKSKGSWVCWKSETRKGKATKVPYSPKGGKAKSNDHRTWGSFKEACYVTDVRGFDGVGLVLVDDLVGYDLDVKGDIVRAGIADEIIREAKRFGCYVELSPSGEGYHIFLRGALPRAGKGSPHSWIEAYDRTSPRYLTVTGSVVVSYDGIPEAWGFIEWMHEKFLHKEEVKVEAAPIQRATVNLTDSELIEKIRASASGVKFDALYSGASGDDHSAADLELCNILAWWTNRDAAQMDRIFRSSGLIRDKWDKRHHSDGRTYGEGTIQTAIAGCSGGYDPQYREPAPALKIKPQRTEPIEANEKNDDWKQYLQWNFKDGVPTTLKRSAFNLALILAHDERCACFGLDEFCDRVGFTSPPPWNSTHQSVVGESGRWWDNADYTRLQFWLAAEYGPTWGKDQIADSMKMVATSRKFHPVRSWLDAQKWDGVSRLDRWTSLYLGAEENPYTSLVGRLWLISAVARIYQPGCKADHVLILEGPQGLKKSTALRLLATVGDQAWFNDTNMHLATKDSYVSLRGSWIVELAELQQLIRAETEDAKAFFTSCVDRYRPPYERDIQEYPRQCVFAGTVNEDRYLRDSTGNRRYWPVKATKIDLHRLESEKAQLWAEAVAAFKGGSRWWPEGEDEIKLCMGEQEERQIGDAWESLIFDFLDSTTSKRLTVPEILKGALGMDAEKVGRREEMRLAKILETVQDWKKSRWVSGGRKIRGFEKAGGQ